MAIKELKLDNGLTILIEDIKDIYSAHIKLVVKAGGYNEDHILFNEGISHFLEHCMFHSNEQFTTEKELHNYTDSIGASLNAYTTHHETGYTISCMKDNIIDALTVLKHIVLNPILDNFDIEKERHIILEEYNSYMNDPNNEHTINTLRHLLQDTIYTNNIIGTTDSIYDITLEDLKKYYNTYYHPSNMILSIVGNISNIDTLFENINNLFNCMDIEIETAPEIPKLLPTHLNIEKYNHVTLDSLEMSSLISYIIPIFNMTKNDRTLLTFISYLLTNSGMNSICMNELRSKNKLIYGISSQFHLLQDIKYDTGLMVIETESSVKHVKDIIEKLDNCLDVLLIECLEDETYFNNIKTIMKSKMIYSLEIPKNRLNILINNKKHFGEVDYSIDKKIEMIDKISKEDVLYFIDKFKINSSNKYLYLTEPEDLCKLYYM